MLSSKIIKKITACCCMAAVMLAASGCSDSKSYVSNSNEPKELKITSTFSLPIFGKVIANPYEEQVYFVVGLTL